VLSALRAEWPLGLFCFCVAAIALSYGLFGSPDVLYDEAAYTWAAQQVALGWHLTLDNQPLFVHPPLPFLATGAWLRLTGYATAPLPTAIHAARVLAVSAGVGDVMLLAALGYRLTGGAPPRRRRVLTGAIAVLAALDPVLVRYDRQNVIEPFALFMSLLVLHAAWHLRDRSGLAYVSVTGLLGGLALLTNEITIFLVIVPLLFALLEQDRRFIARAVAALAIALGFLGLFFVWAVELGQTGAFLTIQTATLQRFVGLLKLTGLNRPGVSLPAELGQSIATFSGTGYTSTYLLLGIGLVGLIWCWSRYNGRSGNFLTAWLTASYACGAYVAGVGTLNEQFFVYLIPAAIVGSVLFADALVVGAKRHYATLDGHRMPAALAGVFFACVAGLSAYSWVANYTTTSDGVEQAVRWVDTDLPSCAAVNASGDWQKYAYLTGGLVSGRAFESFSVGQAGLADGVHYFLLAPTDAAELSGDMTPQLEAWIRANGRELADFPSMVYDSVQVWFVPASRFDADADIVDIAGGVYVNTVGSHCGGYTVTGAFYNGYQTLGGKGIVGDPISTVTSLASGTKVQLFDGAVVVGKRAVPIVEMFAERNPTAYARAVFTSVRRQARNGQRQAWLTDSAITQAYLDGGSYAAAVARYGEPLGPPARAADGLVEQAFADVVLEAPAGGQPVHAVPVTAAALAAGVLSVPAGAHDTQAPPPLPNPDQLGSATPTSAESFTVTLGGVLAAYVAVVAALAWRRRAHSPRDRHVTRVHRQGAIRQ
jgi:hypothetical protein